MALFIDEMTEEEWLRSGQVDDMIVACGESQSIEYAEDILLVDWSAQPEEFEFWAMLYMTSTDEEIVRVLNACFPNGIKTTGLAD